MAFEIAHEDDCFDTLMGESTRSSLLFMVNKVDDSPNGQSIVDKDDSAIFKLLLEPALYDLKMPF